MGKYFKEESRKEWSTDMPVTNDDLRTGAMMRIADAAEKMASNYTRMENDLAMYKRWNEEKRSRIAKLEKSNAALRGHIKRIKRLANQKYLTNK